MHGKIATKFVAVFLFQIKRSCFRIGGYRSVLVSVERKKTTQFIVLPHNPRYLDGSPEKLWIQRG
jgi:hypothetical protein